MGSYQLFGRKGVQTYSHALDVAVSAVTVNGNAATFTDSGTAITISSPAIAGGETIVLTEAVNETTGPDIQKVQVTNFPAQSSGATANQYPGSDYAKDGTDATGVTAPSGGVGIRGWLSGIYGAVTGTLKAAVYQGGSAVSASNALATADQNVLATIKAPGTAPGYVVGVQGTAGAVPIPAALADGGDVTQGSKADTAATSGTGSWTIVQLLKGILTACLAATPAGAAIIGKVGLDQTTPGTTNGVVVNSSALPTGGSTAALQTGAVSYATFNNAALAASATTTQTARAVPSPNPYAKYNAFLLSSTMATYTIRGSNDGFATAVVVASGALTANTPVIFSTPILYADYSAYITNGGTAGTASVMEGFSRA